MESDHYPISAVTVKARRRHNIQDWHKFLRSLHMLEPGQSFVCPLIDKKHLYAITAAEFWFDRRYSTEALSCGWRVGRTN